MDNKSRQSKIVDMFDEIAPTYDVTNRVLSFGIDKSWRRLGCQKAYEILGTSSLAQITDVACGTGDLLLFWKEIADKKKIKVNQFVGIDPAVNMLEIAEKKVDFAEFIEGKAQELPLFDKSSDIVSISYGIRNVVDRVEALKEFNRVLKVGGLVVILEFTKREQKGIFSKVIDFYMTKVLPTIGGLVSRNYAAYKYLPDSIEGFLTTSMLTQELNEAGFSIKFTKSFSFGISTLIIAQKDV